MDASDRCDECGKRAYVRVLLRFSLAELVFCGHHFAVREKRMLELYPLMMVVDFRDQILASDAPVATGLV